MKNIGVSFSQQHCTFTVWAPEKKSMVLHITHPHEQQREMDKDELGYFSTTVEKLSDDALYFFKPDGEHDYPDPASQFQPEGVHGPSQVVNHSAYQWNDAEWHGKPFNELIIYEMHVGTFTPEGTFEAIIPLLNDLRDVGINALELMPVAQFPGARNWGYDAVYPYAVQNS